MNFLKSRKVQISKYSIPLLALIAAGMTVVLALVYVILQFTSTVTVVANPKVSFYNWSTEAKANTFSYDFDIFPSVRTIDENITYGVFCDDTSAHTCYIRVQSLTNAGNIDYLNCTIYNSTSTILSQKWTGTDISSLPTPWETFTAAAGCKYAIWWEVNATSTASGSSTFTMEMKVENP